MSLLDLPCIEVSGTPSEIGEAIGASLQDEIAAMIDRRMRAAESYFAERGVGRVDEMVEAAAACLSVLEEWDPAGHEEHQATASGSSLDAATLYAAANYSDLRDVVCIDQDEGCTSVAIGRGRSRMGELIVGQTWDLHPLDVDSIIAVHRLPQDALETWSVTLAGAPTLIGMNQLGLWTGTTNIKVAGVRTGVCYMSLLHRAIRCHDREEAASIIQRAPRAAAHTFLLADAGGAIELECSATRSVRRDLDDAPIVRTNHCIGRLHSDAEAEPPGPSSLARAARAEGLMNREDLDVESVRRLMIDRDGGVLSINRYPEDGEPTATNACMLGVPAATHFEACRGPADRGQWVRLPFHAAG